MQGFVVWLACLLQVLTLSMVYGMKLSPVESFFLQSRLDKIQREIKAEYKEMVIRGRRNRSIKTFIFPGAGGVDDLVREVNKAMSSSKIVDWKKHRGSIATAAFDGEAVGEAIADLVGDPSSVNEEIHYIGISVGAFCANAAATKTCQQYPNSNVRLTLLDPFCGRGLLDPNYGRNNFGRHATTAVQILNSDDPVPTTNDPLPYCHCIDVTGAPERDSFVPLPGDSMHAWPVAYFARHYQESKLATSERGTVVVVGSADW